MGFTYVQECAAMEVRLVFDIQMRREQCGMGI
jgi:hypothetical protein